MQRRKTLALALALGLGLLALLGHRWLALGWNAWHYPTAPPQARTQLAVTDGVAYLAAGTDGIEIVDLRSRQRVALLPLRPPADRIDDLTVADGLLFALDATPPGHLMTYRLAGSSQPSPTGSVEEVAVGPFSGVSAAAGVVAVSGGTSRLTLREYDRDGRFSAEVASADYGRGQPDVALRPDGRMAAISTHIAGPDFAITFAEIGRQPLRIEAVGRLALRAAGFTAGGFKPAHFPLVTAWRGERLYIADAGGLAVVDVSHPERPRILQRDRRCCATGSTAPASPPRSPSGACLPAALQRRSAALVTS